MVSAVDKDSSSEKATQSHETSPGSFPIDVDGLQTVIDGKTIHKDLNLKMKPREILGLVGASGSGKSVLLQSLIGLRKPEAGIVKILGIDVYKRSDVERRGLTSRWGVVFQENALFSTLTVLENIALVLREQADVPEELAMELAQIKLVMAELPPEAGMQLPSELSGGMRKRAAVARAIATDPELLLFDEPTTGLDPVVATKLDDLILQLRATLGVSILVITHDLDTLFGICDRVAVLADQRIIALGAPNQVAQKDHPWIKHYFQGERGKAAAQSAAAGRTRGQIKRGTALPEVAS
jgi:phospholipid/cholesterol/gamma-HCH transport system ATP-binding protein